ncbi:hypothetical protein CMV_007278 [Castanea mollissima]|uniref:Uncharacterized protein n=1 Tax=Castanea mollissima TaxID=60419 RepID=A0A8J4RAD2_9ROSI|nr:hypothetical protein CMV_007278 [Castanea mollissima]
MVSEFQDLGILAVRGWGFLWGNCLCIQHSEVFVLLQFFRRINIGTGDWMTQSSCLLLRRFMQQLINYQS